MSKLGFMLIAIAAIGCDSGDDDDVVIVDPGPGDPGDDGEPIPPDTSFELRALIDSYDIYNPINGTAVVTIIDENAFNAFIEIRSDLPGAERPWHVHFGTCGSGGPIVGPEAAYPGLFVDFDGTATGETTILFPLERTAQYHVNVHESFAEFSTLIACGDLIRQ